MRARAVARISRAQLEWVRANWRPVFASIRMTVDLLLGEAKFAQVLVLVVRASARNR